MYARLLVVGASLLPPGTRFAYRAREITFCLPDFGGVHKCARRLFLPPTADFPTALYSPVPNKKIRQHIAAVPCWD